jgi:hypothetical protein
VTAGGNHGRVGNGTSTESGEGRGAVTMGGRGGIATAGGSAVIAAVAPARHGTRHIAQLNALRTLAMTSMRPPRGCHRWPRYFTAMISFTGVPISGKMFAFVSILSN